MKKTQVKKKLSSEDFRSIVDILLEKAFEVKVSYKPKKDYRE